MDDDDDRNRAKREDVEAAFTKRKWNPDVGANSTIISHAVAYAQTIHAVACNPRLATTCLVSDLFFKQDARAFRSTLDRLQQIQREFRGKYAPITYNPTEDSRAKTFPTVNPDGLLTEDNPYFQRPYPPTGVPAIEQAEFRYMLLQIIGMFCPADLGRNLASGMARPSYQKNELAAAYVDRSLLSHAVYHICAALPAGHTLAHVSWFNSNHLSAPYPEFVDVIKHISVVVVIIPQTCCVNQ